MVFGKLVSGSEKNEQTRQVADIRSRVLEEECGLKIEAEPEAFCMYALAYEGDTPVATGGITFDGESYRIQEVAVLPEFRRKKYGDFIVRLLIDKAMLSGAQTIEADVRRERKYCFRKSDLRRLEPGMKKKAGSGSQCSCRREISINAATVDSRHGV